MLSSLVVILAILPVFLLQFLLLNTNDTFASIEMQPPKAFEKLIAQFWNWWINLPASEDPELPEIKCVSHSVDSTVFFLNPFQMSKQTETCEIPAGHSILFPFYSAWCDSGNSGLYGETSYEKLLDCALDADRGLVSMEAWLNNKKIIDIIFDNRDIKNPKLIKNNLPQSNHYKEITSSELFNITVTNTTQYESWEKPQEFQSSPVTYKAVGHCFCGFIDKDVLPVGNHQLIYHTNLQGSGGLDKTKGWDFDTTITYNFKIVER